MSEKSAGEQRIGLIKRDEQPSVTLDPARACLYAAKSLRCSGGVCTIAMAGDRNRKFPLSHVWQQPAKSAHVALRRKLAGYGTLADLTSHVTDLAHCLVGPIKRVVSDCRTFIKERPLPVPGRGTHFSLGKPGDATGEVTNEDYTGAPVEFQNGCQGTFEASRTIFGPKCENAFDVYGTAGAVSGRPGVGRK